MGRPPTRLRVALAVLVCCGALGARAAPDGRLRRQTSGGSGDSDTACVMRHIGDGEFKEECRSIRAECDQKQCPVDTVCGLDLDENITCFDASVKEFENCGPESFRLQQPCPADAGIRGFGMGCTFCKGYTANEFLGGRGSSTPQARGGLTTAAVVMISYLLM
ncbi:hypothetical protein FJT64_023673 [Amphibalanus amphitrite]|uniref:Uncharacterized protein n=1 Tax=Amphibalanus amphitrite TaxID=1232801 RepID=A0A6A4W0M6_AMPAM|nr:hypothetical protein FJT64_027382 [Amphibalanus amphitrite]KAF0304501.1 hypothetical protein FJT64_023673 [Amphibalanus amphitrite]